MAVISAAARDVADKRAVNVCAYTREVDNSFDLHALGEMCTFSDCIYDESRTFNISVPHLPNVV